MYEKKLLIIGASGHGKVIADIAIKMKRWTHIVFLDDDENLKAPLGLKIVGKLKDVYKLINECEVMVGIGNNTIREEIQEKLKAKGARIPVLIHPSAIIGEQTEFKPGTVIMAGAVVNCCSKIGEGCIINTGVTVDHDCHIDNYVHLSPGSHIAGNVQVGRGSWLGIGSVVSNNVTIPPNCKIGAGSVVIRSINAAGTYVGVPVRRVNKIDEDPDTSK